MTAKVEVNMAGGAGGIAGAEGSLTANVEVKEVTGPGAGAVVGLIGNIDIEIAGAETGAGAGLIANLDIKVAGTGP